MPTDIDFLLLNGRIWTGNPCQPWAEAVAAASGTIVALGNTSELQTLANSRTKVIDAGNRLVLPGLIDNHTHFVTGGFHLLSVDLRSAASAKEFAGRIADKARTMPVGRWLTGGGWNHELWSPARLPAKDLIDACAPDHPVFVTRMDLHMGLANSRALAIAGIDRNTPNPAGGYIERDPATGEPTGIVKDAAMDLVTAKIPKPSEAEFNQALAAALKHSAALGITSIQDITSWEDWMTMRRFRENGWLTVRIYARTPIPEWERQLDVILEQGTGDEWLKLGGVKGFVDGALGSGTALMLQPYDDEPGNAGLLYEQMYPEGIMTRRATSAIEAGLPVSIHAIGDSANRLLIDMYQAIMAETKTSSRGLRVEHAQHLHPTEIERIGKLGFVASMQPVHLLDDGSWAERRLGPVRSATTIACRSLLDAGARVTFGTDWPVAPLDPMLGIYAAVTRKPTGVSSAWHPEQRITVEEAVKAYTTTGAYAEFSEHTKGSLEPGKVADMVILSQDIFSVEPDAIPETKVVFTILNGKVIYQR
jgi:predicted amidohydrolase YtcJ